MASADDVRLFTSRTGASEQVAREQLQAAGGDVDRAVQRYRAQAARPSSSRPGGRSGNVRGLSDYHGDDGDDSDPEGNEYYAGGEKSGQVVRGAPSNRVEDVFDAARAAGAREGTTLDLNPAETSRAFQGRARTLQGTVVEGDAGGPSEPQPQALVINFYRNGFFQVGDGPGRSIADPANAGFMQSIMRGTLPPELEPADPATPINVNLVRKDEDWDERAAPKTVAFTGSGMRLGGAGTSAPPAAAAPAAAPAPAATWQGPDESKPLTSLQIRLADGSRLVAKFNLSQTVEDVRAFIRTARPDLAPGFRLATAFPAQPLEDNAATIQEAGLANAVVIQKS